MKAVLGAGGPAGDVSAGSRGARPTVALHFEGPPPSPASHQRVTMDAVARALARLKGGDLAAPGAAPRAARLYLVPDETLLWARAEALGIRSADDLFGGVVPHPVLRTKAVTHDLVAPDAARPAGWPDRFVASVRDVVLPGHAAFSRADARAAAARLWPRGPVRVKPCLAAGGRGQAVVDGPEALEAFLDALPPDDLTGGLVLETNLEDVRTLSVGQVRVDRLLVTYHGVQSTTTDNRGCAVYGGSDLVCVRGGWGALERRAPAPRTRQAITAARAYDAATKHVPGFVASRRNYDVAVGRDRDGRWRLGVLEASWRAGGATPAEVAALEAFARDPSLQVVRASCVEAFGRGLRVPPGATFAFEGEDPAWGPMVRYALVTAGERRDP
jgi:hypothetical protein